MAHTYIKHKPHDIFCIVCGKKADNLIDGKFCSGDCSAKYTEGLLESIFCNRCGVEFDYARKNTRFCPECVKLNNNCTCFYPYRASLHKDVHHPPAFSGTRRKRKSECWLDQIDRACKESGRTYGYFQKEETLRMLRDGKLR